MKITGIEGYLLGFPNLASIADAFAAASDRRSLNVFVQINSGRK